MHTTTVPYDAKYCFLKGTDPDSFLHAVAFPFTLLQLPAQIHFPSLQLTCPAALPVLKIHLPAGSTPQLLLA